MRRLTKEEVRAAIRAGRASGWDIRPRIPLNRNTAIHQMAGLAAPIEDGMLLERSDRRFVLARVGTHAE